MARRGAAVLILWTLVVPLFAGCTSAPEPGDGLARPDWEVGDRWVYQLTSNAGQSTYVREVTSLFAKGAYQVFEVTEGVEGGPTQQYSFYTLDRLQFMGMEVRNGPELRTRLDPVSPLTFHYIFPLVPGRSVEESGQIRQESGVVTQLDTVEIEAHVAAQKSLTLGDRVYSVYPYEIRIRYTTTPFDEVAVIRGHWAPGVGQSVLTTVTEGEQERTYELVSFQRARPADGPPVYGLVDGLTSRVLTRGFDASLEGAGYTRHFFHVEAPTTVGVSFSQPGPHTREHIDRIDLVTIRPLGYARAGIATNATVTEPGMVFHMAATRAGGQPTIFHSPPDARLDQVHLTPGQVYELVVASNTGPVRAEIGLGPESQHLRPVETGRAQVLAVQHERVQDDLEPGPQNVRDRLETLVAVSEETRIEGIVFGIDHGDPSDPLELEASRQITYSVDSFALTDPSALYGFFVGYQPRDPFAVSAGFSYRADLALQPRVDYELGAFLLRLVPPE